MADNDEPWMRLLRDLFGPDADAAADEMRRMGMDPSALAQAAGVASSPAMMDHVIAQVRALMAQSNGEDVNWTLAHDVARGVAAQGGDPTVSAAVAKEYRSAVTEAELWLDAATDFDPSRETPSVFSKAEWVEATLPTWRYLAGPVASSVSQALGGVLKDELEIAEAAGGSGILSHISPTVCGMHVGQAAGALGAEAFGSTDLGFPLMEKPHVVLIPRAIEAFADGLDIPATQVRLFIALREAAHVRLFTSVPWLAGQLHAAIERYARGVSVDLEALDEAVRGAGLGDPQKLQAALTTGIFSPQHSPEQARTLEEIETLLALIEGWVDEVTARAALPHLPSLGQLREMMRRRRAAGGPAEDTFASLLGLTLRPRKLRDASSLWAQLGAMKGPHERDALWSHPDILPDARAMENWQEWLNAYTAEAGEDDLDAELRTLLGDS